MTKRLVLVAFLALMPHISLADKIIMKDGKIYEGHIMGESQKTLLISNPPTDPKPRFIELRDVMTIVRDRRPEEKPTSEEGRFASVHMGLVGRVFSSPIFSFSPAPSVYFGGGFRIHPSIELGGEFNWTPSLSGAHLGVSDGTQSRAYENFYAYDGGFSAKMFPFFKMKDWRMEPYLTTGYHWSRLTPKASGDELKGTALFGGAGVLIPWWKPLYWDFRFVYGHTNLDSIHFLGGDGTLSGVTYNSYDISAGLSYRFL